jgi:hypothetical protein
VFEAGGEVVKKYEKDGKLKYVRHHAFEPRRNIVIFSDGTGHIGGDVCEGDTRPRSQNNKRMESSHF